MRLTKTFRDAKKLKRTKHLLTKPFDGYVRPTIGFDTTTTVWRIDETIKKNVRDWMSLLNEDGYSGHRESVARKDLTIYTGTYSVFPFPLAEKILLRYAGEEGGLILDAFAGGPPRALASAALGYRYIGHDISSDQIDTNMEIVRACGFEKKIMFIQSDARDIEYSHKSNSFDFAFTCPPYWNVEVYSDDPNDLSTFETYEEFDQAMYEVIEAHFDLMKDGAFVCIVVGNFRNKEGALIDFRGHTVDNFVQSGFIFHQEVILSKNFGSAAKRAANAWKGKKLVPTHEHLLVFKKPEPKLVKKKKTKRVRVRLEA